MCVPNILSLFIVPFPCLLQYVCALTSVYNRFLDMLSVCLTCCAPIFFLLFLPSTYGYIVIINETKILIQKIFSVFLVNIQML